MKFKVDGYPPRPSRRTLIAAGVVAVSLFACARTPGPEEHARLREAKELLGRGAVAQSMDLLEPLIEEGYEWQELHALAGRAYALSERIDRAGTHLELALSLGAGRQSALWLTRIAAASGEGGQIARARGAIEELIAGDEGDFRLYHALAMLLELEGDIAGALGAFEYAASLTRQAARAHLDLGRIYQRVGLSGRAADSLQTARSLAEEGPIAEAAEALLTRMGSE